MRDYRLPFTSRQFSMTTCDVLDRYDDPHAPPRNIVLQTELVIRESTAPPPHD